THAQRCLRSAIPLQGHTRPSNMGRGHHTTLTGKWRGGTAMSIDQMKEIANAVLYEGYLLYPYRQSAIKNRQRWSIGVIYPREYSKANGEIEPWLMQTECLVAGQENSDTLVDVYVRFLHLLTRTTTIIDETAGKRSFSAS